jgi:hypothetical protein
VVRKCKSECEWREDLSLFFNAYVTSHENWEGKPSSDSAKKKTKGGTLHRKLELDSKSTAGKMLSWIGASWPFGTAVSHRPFLAMLNAQMWKLSLMGGGDIFLGFSA